MKRFYVAVAIAGAGAALAGCGGDDGDSGGGGPTNAEFISEVDDICREKNREVAPVEQSIDDKLQSGDTAEAAEDIRTFITTADEVLDGIRAITPPEGDEEFVTSYVDAVSAQKAVIRRLADAIEAEDQQRVRTVSVELGKGQKRVEELAQGYGFKACGSGT